MDITTIKQALNARALEVCQHLLPGGRKVGNEYRAASINGGQGSSLGVHLNGPKTGLFKDFAEEGISGDLIDLFSHVNGVENGDAIKLALDYLGEAPPSASNEHDRKPEWLPVVPIPEEARQVPVDWKYGKPTKTWRVRNTDGELACITCRFDRPAKKFFSTLTFGRHGDGPFAVGLACIAKATPAVWRRTPDEAPRCPGACGRGREGARRRA